jgi:Plavaka transposase
MTGGRVAHPLLISLANLLMDFRTKATNHAFLLLALLPTPKFVHNDRKIRGVLENRLIHECLDFILQPLKKAAEVGIMMSDPLGSLRYVYTPLAAYIVDTQEAVVLAGVAGKTSHLTMAMYKDFGDAFKHPPRTASMTLKQLSAIEKVADPWDLDVYIKQAMVYRLNGVHRPFWRDWPLSDPSEFFTPEPLHHWHKMFWDHDAQWCIRAMGPAEIDFRFSILHPLTGFRQFPEGISKLKQVTGREHRDIQRYLVAIIADRVPKDFLIAIRALADFRYLSQSPEISDEVCTQIDHALLEFHDHKDAIIRAGARTGKSGIVIDNWYIPKLEFLQSVTSSIFNSGATIQWSADHTERCHITEIKIPSRSTNNQGYESQICRYLDRDEKCRQFDLATAICEARMDFGRLIGPSEDNDSNFINEPNNDSPVVTDSTSALLSHIRPDTLSSRTTQHHANYFELADALERDMYPNSPLPPRTFVRGYTALHLRRDPNMTLTINDAMKSFNLPDLRGALADFFQHGGDNPPLVGGRRTANANAQIPFDCIQIWTKLRLQNHAYHAPHNILPAQTVNALPPSESWTFGHSDVVLVNTDSSHVWPSSGLKGIVMYCAHHEIVLILFQGTILFNYA